MVPAFPWPPLEPPVFALTKQTGLHPPQDLLPLSTTPSLCVSLSPVTQELPVPFSVPPKPFESRNSGFCLLWLPWPAEALVCGQFITVTGMHSGHQSPVQQNSGLWTLLRV